MQILYSIYNPFIISQYYIFLWKKEKGQVKIFPQNEIYGLLSKLNTISPIWSELFILLLLSHVIILYQIDRLIILSILVFFNNLISKRIIKHLKQINYIELVISQVDMHNLSNSKYSKIYFCCIILILYAIIPIVPIAIYLIL